MAIDSYSSYICCIGNLTSNAKLPEKGTKWEQNVRENYTSDDVIDRGANSTSQQAASRLPEACDFSLSQFAFVLAHENESGCIQEIVVEVISHQNHILKNLRAFLTLERPDNGVMLLSRCWFGTGSLFGFDITLSISKIQTIMSMSSSLSEVASQNTIKKLEKNDWSYSHEVDNCLEAMIPDGAIVAIQDVNQHMYFTVEVKYDANENQMVTDLFQQRRILKRRYYLVERAKDANIVGILVGTLGVDGAGYLHIINQMKELITRAGKKAYTLVMGKSNPAKLANFPEEWDWDLALLVCLDILGIFILGHPHLVLLIQNCKIRYYLVERAKDANIVGILVGTLGVDGAGYLHIINQMKELITRAGKKAYTLVMGKSNPAKLANFPEEWDWDLALLVCLDILGIFILGHPHLVLLIQNCKIRYYLVERAKDANIVGILVGTLGVDGAGYLHIINQMKELITRAGKKAYTLVMGKSNPAKLANFPEEFSFWDILILFFLFRIAKSGY
ncbi:Diphthamide synthesis DPH1/DPH2 [Vigna unguiculata]|uniref:Diphthamide synthesis DPH1/DPH2 n=1 Tax=Vigna unguiculata TaxID=3917 RepID=A0A4D6L1M9_VIGUN|nr:Diphthamide synthesis DPH1/DPH2 [Vigna unguiculata]